LGVLQSQSSGLTVLAAALGDQYDDSSSLSLVDQSCLFHLAESHLATFLASAFGLGNDLEVDGGWVEIRIYNRLSDYSFD
jgi:hypothetical protein